MEGGGEGGGRAEGHCGGRAPHPGSRIKTGTRGTRRTGTRPCTRNECGSGSLPPQPPKAVACACLAALGASLRKRRPQERRRWAERRGARERPAMRRKGDIAIHSEWAGAGASERGAWQGGDAWVTNPPRDDNSGVSSRGGCKKSCLPLSMLATRAWRRSNSTSRACGGGRATQRRARGMARGGARVLVVCVRPGMSAQRPPALPRPHRSPSQHSAPHTCGRWGGGGGRLLHFSRTRRHR